MRMFDAKSSVQCVVQIQSYQRRRISGVESSNRVIHSLDWSTPSPEWLQFSRTVDSEAGWALRGRAGGPPTWKSWNASVGRAAVVVEGEHMQDEIRPEYVGLEDDWG